MYKKFSQYFIVAPPAKMYILGAHGRHVNMMARACSLLSQPTLQLKKEAFLLPLTTPSPPNFRIASKIVKGATLYYFALSMPHIPL